MGMNADRPPPPCGVTHRNKKRRSRSGCMTCRARKVKCDERPDGCANCEKLHLECSGYNQSRQRSSAAGKRTYRSCNACRLARCKCSGERPACARCRADSLACSYNNDTAEASFTSSPSTRIVLAHAPNGSRDIESSSYQNSETPLESFTDASHLPWLVSRQLPERKHIRILVASYFQNFHHLRCFAFIHKPSFLRKLDERLATGLQDNALLHIMCALGAQYYALEHSDTVQELPCDFVLMAGSHWAKTAEQLLLGSTHEITVEGLMTAQLLYDYALRMAKFTQAFILSALMARMTQALQINLEYSTDVLHQTSNGGLSTTVRESRRRLMWSCYITDVLCGSGVDQLSLIHEHDIKIQLPCNNRNFLHERPCVTRTITGTVLDFLPPPLVPADINGNMGMLAYFVQQMEIRRRVLRYIKKLDRAKAPWLPDSEFAMLDSELKDWYNGLPENLRFTTATTYLRQESSQLAALCLFHCAYHQTMCDLYRIGTPALYKLRSAFPFPTEQAQYQRQLQWCLFKEARALAAIIAEGQRHGPSTIGDSWLPTITYDSNRIMLFYLTQVIDSPTSSKRDLVLSTIPLLHSNLKALKSMMNTNVVAKDLARAAEAMLEKLGVNSNNVRSMPAVILEDPYLAQLNRNRRSLPGSPVQSAPDYVLNPLSIFRMARNDIPEGHAPEQTPNPECEASRRRHVSYSEESLTLARVTEPTRETNDMYNSAFDAFVPNFGHFFASDTSLSVNWQPAELIVGSGMESDGLLPWIPTSQLGGSAFGTQT